MCWTALLRTRAGASSRVFLSGVLMFGGLPELACCASLIRPYQTRNIHWGKGKYIENPMENFCVVHCLIAPPSASLLPLANSILANLTPAIRMLEHIPHISPELYLNEQHKFCASTQKRAPERNKLEHIAKTEGACLKKLARASHNPPYCFSSCILTLHLAHSQAASCFKFRSP
jgi:hypothetical protein